MDCKTVRERIETDPANLDRESALHVEDCVACAAYAERVRNSEWIIHEALRFDVAALKQGAARQPAVRRTIVYSQRVWAGVAATLVVGLAVWFGSSVTPTIDHSELVAEVAEHWYQEPHSWTRTDVQVSPASLEGVVGGRAEIDISELGLLSYAHSCFVRGEWVPHLVMQGEHWTRHVAAPTSRARHRAGAAVTAGRGPGGCDRAAWRRQYRRYGRSR